MVTRRPRALSRRPRLAAVSPLPRLDTTPPVTKMCLVTGPPGLAPTDALRWGIRGCLTREGEPVGPGTSGYHRSPGQPWMLGRPPPQGPRHGGTGSGDGRHPQTPGHTRVHSDDAPD